MIDCYKNIEDLTSAIDGIIGTLDEPIILGETFNVRPKDYKTLLDIYGLDKDGLIDTPWGTVVSMQNVFEAGNAIWVDVARVTKRGKDYLVKYGGWSYPSGAFELIGVSTKNIHGDIKNLRELKEYT